MMKDEFYVGAIFRGKGCVLRVDGYCEESSLLVCTEYRFTDADSLPRDVYHQIPLSRVDDEFCTILGADDTVFEFCGR